MPFPSEAYKAFCIKYQEVFGKLWEPKPGDFCYGTDWDVIRSQVGLEPEGRMWIVVDYWGTEKVRVWAPTRHHIAVGKDKLAWIPRQDQLQEMLEKTVGRRFGVVPVEYKGDKYWIVPLAGSSIKRHIEGKLVNVRGPDSETALAKALIEVMEKEEDLEEFIMQETEAAIEGGIIDENTGLPFELAGPEEGDN